MFADFSKILTENFIVSFLAPSVLFIIISSIIFLPLIPEIDTKTGDDSSLSSADINNLTKETFLPYKLQLLWEDNLGLLSFLSFALSIFLLLFNRPMIRMLEGYYLLFIPGVLYFKRKKFQKLKEDLENTQNKLRELNKLKELKQKSEDEHSKKEYLMLLMLREKYRKLGTKLRTEFPFDPEYLLPTSFGNAIRSFETYSYRVYGIEAIACWPRIIDFASEPHRRNINDASSRVDFSVNSLYLMTIIFFELLVMYSLESIHQRDFIIYELFTVVVLICLWKYSIMSVKLWGNEVKSVFDLYRYDLFAKLNGLKEITNENIPRDEEEYWHLINSVFLYHTKWKDARLNKIKLVHCLVDQLHTRDEKIKK